MLLSVCIIIRKGTTFISRTLNSVSQISDEIIIIDTGLLEGIKKIVGKTDVCISTYKCDDISKVKNYALQKAQSKWVLFLNDDEELGQGSNDLRIILPEQDYMGYYLPVIDIDCQVETGIPRLMLRLIKKKGNYIFRGKNGEEVTSSLFNTSIQGMLQVLQIPILHHQFDYTGQVSQQGQLYKFKTGEVDNLKFWQGCLLLKVNKYEKAEMVFKKINPGFDKYSQVLDLLWIISLSKNCISQTKYIIKQIKLRGEDLSYQVISVFTERYYYNNKSSLDFNNLGTRYNFYKKCIYYLDLFLEYTHIKKAIRIMLDIFDELKVKTTSGDLGRIFYKHQYLQEALCYLENSLHKGDVLQELILKADIYYQMKMYNQAEKFYHKVLLIDSCHKLSWKRLILIKLKQIKNEIINLIYRQPENYLFAEKLQLIESAISIFEKNSSRDIDQLFS